MQAQQADIASNGFKDGATMQHELKTADVERAANKATPDLPPVRYVFAPDFLPNDRTYFVVGEPETIPLLRNLGFKVAGAAISADGARMDASASTILVSTPSWPQQIEALLTAGISPDRIVVLLHATPDPYAWWDFFRSLSEPFDPAAPLEKQLTAFRAHLSHWASAKVAHNRLFTIHEYYVAHADSIVAEAAPRIHRVLRGLADGRSVETYARVIYGKPEDLFEAAVRHTAGDQQYSEIVRLCPGDHIVNCGVGAAWELPFFVVMLQGCGRIYNVDPTILQLWSAHGPLEKFSGLMTDIVAAVSDVDGPKKYTFVHHMFYDLNERVLPQDGDLTTYTIDTFRIDSLVSSGKIERIDYLKFDIEGSELAALRGAIGSIKRFRPRIAVAIYHSLSHFWDIPTYLMDELLDYDFYVRSYSYHRFETLLYAIPKEDRASRPSKNNSVAKLGEASPKKADANLLFYLQDKEDRGGYDIARRNVITRFSGCDWPGAELRPGPNVAGLESLVVIDQLPNPLIVARTVGSDAVTLGRLSEAGVAWIAQTAFPQAHVGFAGHLGGRPVLPVQVNGSGKVALTELNGEGFHWLREVAVAKGDVLGLWNLGSGAEPVLLIQDGQAFFLQNLDDCCTIRLNLGAGAVVIGVAVARPFGGSKTSAQVALVVQFSDKKPARVFVSDGGGNLRNVGEIDLSEFRLVSTISGANGQPGPLAFARSVAFFRITGPVLVQKVRVFLRAHPVLEYKVRVFLRAHPVLEQKVRAIAYGSPVLWWRLRAHRVRKPR